VHGARHEAEPFDHGADLSFLRNRHEQTEARSNGAPEPKRPEGTLSTNDDENGVIRVDVDTEERVLETARALGQFLPMADPILNALWLAV